MAKCIGICLIVAGLFVFYMLAADQSPFPIRLPARLYSCGTFRGEWKCRRLMWLTASRMDGVE